MTSMDTRRRLLARVDKLRNGVQLDPGSSRLLDDFVGGRGSLSSLSGGSPTLARIAADPEVRSLSVGAGREPVSPEMLGNQFTAGAAARAGAIPPAQLRASGITPGGGADPLALSPSRLAGQGIFPGGGAPPGGSRAPATQVGDFGDGSGVVTRREAGIASPIGPGERTRNLRTQIRGLESIQDPQAQEQQLQRINSNRTQRGMLPIVRNEDPNIQADFIVDNDPSQDANLTSEGIDDAIKSVMSTIPTQGEAQVFLDGGKRYKEAMSALLAAGSTTKLRPADKLRLVRKTRDMLDEAFENTIYTDPREKARLEQERAIEEQEAQERRAFRARDRLSMLRDTGASSGDPNNPQDIATEAAAFEGILKEAAEIDAQTILNEAKNDAAQAPPDPETQEQQARIPDPVRNVDEDAIRANFVGISGEGRRMSSKDPEFNKLFEVIATDPSLSHLESWEKNNLLIRIGAQKGFTR